MTNLAKRIAAIEQAVRLSALRGTLELHRPGCDCTTEMNSEQDVYTCGGVACAEHAGCHVDIRSSAQPGRTTVITDGLWLGF